MKPPRRAALCAAIALAALSPRAGAAEQTLSVSYPTWDGKQETARYATPDAAAALREYTHSTTVRLRDPGPPQVAYRESAELPRVRSGNLAFDALFALAGAEMKQNSVAEIRDSSYNGGQAIACDCFETGEQWHYVWTRDLSYAAHLGLAMLDPRRVRNSLLFKLSGYRPGVDKPAHAAGGADGLQIIQDTGSGGSWPVSTDRISWAFGAEAALQALPSAERKAFAATALRALKNTLDNDRLAAYDRASGLYTGEQSFLDWREQSYAAWIADDLASMASSKSLSTNVGHYKALQLAAQLAREQGDGAAAAKYAKWAADLKQAVNARLWLADAGLYSSLTAGHFDGVPLHKYDWLGQSLAIVTGVADRDRAHSILANYPHGPMGAPVIYPQQAGVPVYHNRAIWPFVTAYGLQAAALAGHAGVADAAYDTLMRGAALNLSNMENLEWLSGQAMLTDAGNPSLNGPVINSKRQLWSVGAYLGMVIGNVFGVSTTADGIALRPFVTARLRREQFAGQAAVLDNLQLQGKRMQVRLLLPPAAESDGDGDGGYYAVESIALNGAAAAATIPWQRLAADNVIEIRLGQLLKGQHAMRAVSAAPLVQERKVFAPHEVSIASLARGTYGLPTLHIADERNPAGSVLYNVYRDGRLVAERLSTRTWSDRSAAREAAHNATGARGACYAVEALYPDSGNRSHHSAPRCLDAGIEIPAGDMRVASSVAVARGRAAQWGAPDDTFSVRDIRIARAGGYRFQLAYRNTAHQINLGISGGVKWMTVQNQAGKTVAQGVVQLPHTRADQDAPAYSTPLRATLKAGSYSLQLADFYNMSYLHSNSTFGAAGGIAGPSNRFDIHGVRVLPAPEKE